MRTSPFTRPAHLPPDADGVQSHWPALIGLWVEWLDLVRRLLINLLILANEVIYWKLVALTFKCRASAEPISKVAGQR